MVTFNTDFTANYEGIATYLINKKPIENLARNTKLPMG